MRIVKWLGVVVVVLTVVVFAVLIIGSQDIERPDDAAIRVELSARPPDRENVYPGFVAATNAVRVKAEGNPMRMPADEADRLVATNVEALAIFHEAANRRVWYDVDVRDGGSMIVGITGLMHLCGRAVPAGEWTGSGRAGGACAAVPVRSSSRSVRKFASAFLRRQTRCHLDARAGRGL